MRNLLAAVLVLLTLATPAQAAFLAPVPESTPSSPLVVELSLSELPKVRLTPKSPLFFLKIWWENLHLLVERIPRDKARLALGYAQVRLSEALKLSAGKVNLAVVERLFQERARLLEKAHRLGGSDAEVRREISRQLDLGRIFLEDLLSKVSPEESPRVQNLLVWREGWVARLEEGLGSGEPADLAVEASPSAGPAKDVLEATKAASFKESVPGRSSFLERFFNFIFGGEPLLSPLAAPEGD